MTKQALLDNLTLTVESAFSQDEERIRLAAADGRGLFLARMIGPDGRLLDGIPNPFTVLDAELGTGMDSHDIVDHAKQRGASAVIISGPLSMDGELYHGKQDSRVLKLAAESGSHMQVHDVTCIGVQVVLAEGTVRISPVAEYDAPMASGEALDSFLRVFAGLDQDEKRGMYSLAEILGIDPIDPNELSDNE